MDTYEPSNEKTEVAAAANAPMYAGGPVAGGAPPPTYAGGPVAGGVPAPMYTGGPVAGGVPAPMYAGGPVPGGVPPPMYAGGPVPGGVPPPMYVGGPVPGGVPPLVHHALANVLYSQNTYPQYTANYPGYPQGPNMVVTTQPMIAEPRFQVYEKDYMGYSIFTMLCCCLPLGIAALVYSCSTQSANERGDIIQAQQNSRTARQLNNLALGIGICCTIGWIAYVIYINVAVRRYSRNYYG